MSSATITRHRSTAALVMALATACGVIGSDYVPTAEVFRRRTQSFITRGATALKPSYGNVDVDSLVGSYAVPAAMSNDAIFSEIERRAAGDGWRLVRRGGNFREFHKLVPGKLASFELARIRLDDRRRVVIGWLQADGVAAADEAARSVEGKWAERELWPRFEGPQE